MPCVSTSLDLPHILEGEHIWNNSWTVAKWERKNWNSFFRRRL